MLVKERVEDRINRKRNGRLEGMKVFIDKPGIDSILKQGNIIEFAFDGKPNNIGIYVGRDQTGHTIILLEHPAFVPGTLMTYSYMDDVKLFKGTVTLSND